MVVLPRGTSPTVVATIDPQGKIQKGGGDPDQLFSDDISGD